ncbi:hypothetical protein LZ31DRAFT_168711 [Colletotrichum somersetense]|nr:hypothetical protein LZ31DRAFT_168711 [Colletotrichum somersetense]
MGIFGFLSRERESRAVRRPFIDVCFARGGRHGWPSRKGNNCRYLICDKRPSWADWCLVFSAPLFPSAREVPRYAIWATKLEDQDGSGCRSDDIKSLQVRRMIRRALSILSVCIGTMGYEFGHGRPGRLRSHMEDHPPALWLRADRSVGWWSSQG